MDFVYTWTQCDCKLWFNRIESASNDPVWNSAIRFSLKLMADRWPIESGWVDKWQQLRCKRARRATMSNCQLKTSWNELKRAETSRNELKWRCIHSILLVLLICISISQTLAPSKRYACPFHWLISNHLSTSCSYFQPLPPAIVSTRSHQRLISSDLIRSHPTPV